MLARTSFAFLFLILSLPACSSASSSTSGSGQHTVGGPAFSKYCTGTLLHEMPLTINQADGWADNGSQAPSGTDFLLSVEFQQWQGYVIQDDGTPEKIKALNGLVQGTDFSSSCAPSTMPDQFTTNLVLLADTTLYPNFDLSGKACTLPAGTVLTNYDLEGGTPVTASADEITAKCGAKTMYTMTFTTGQLLNE